MTTSDDHAIYEVPAPRTHAFSLERGGRLGYTLTLDYEDETFGDNLSMFIIGVVAAATGYWLITGWPGTLTVFIGGLMAGTANERMTWMREGDRQEDTDA